MRPPDRAEHPLRRQRAAGWLAVLLLGCAGGDSLAPNPVTPTTVMALGEHHACVGRPTGTLCWGRGAEGQLGIGVTPVDTIPTLLPDSIDFVDLAAGEAHTCGLDADGAAFCWGSDRDGQLGFGAAAAERCGAFPCATRPQPVAGDLRFRQLAAGPRFTCGLTVDGPVYCWGLNDVGQLGTASASETCEDGRCSRTPLAEASGRSFSSITAGLSHVCALDPGGATFCWGWDGPSGTGQGHHPTFTPDAYAVPGPTFRQLSAGGYHTCGLEDDGSAYCWGIDAIGAGPALLEADHPVAVIGGIRFRSVRSARLTACGLDAAGAAYCWGPNFSGEIGREPVGSLQRFDQPAAVAGDLRFEIIEPGSSTYCGVTAGDAVFCWGRGDNGELGAGHRSSTSPVAVPLPS